MNTHRALNPHETSLLQAWRTLALEKAPFFATILYSLRPVSVPGMSTMGVDKHLRLYIDFEACQQWGPDACGQVLLHECGHVIGDHAAMSDELGLRSQDAKVFNLAADMAINDDLVTMGCGFIESTGQLPKHIDMKEHLTPVDYYARLKELMQQQQQQQDSGAGGSPNGSHSSDNSAGDSAESTDGGDSNGSAGGSLTDLSNTCGSIAHGAQAPWELDASESMKGQAKPAARVEVERVISDSIAAVKQQAGRMPGAASLVETGLITQAAGSITDWRTRISPVLSTALTNKRGSKTSYRRISRRFQPQIGSRRILLPGRVAPRVSLACLLDTSASMTDNQRSGAVLREVDAIHRRIVGGKGTTYVVDADTEVHDIRVYEPGTITEVTGLGGTDMAAAIIACLQDRRLNGVNPINALVCITDGETHYPQWADVAHISPRIPVIACVLTPTGEIPDHFPVPDWITAVPVASVTL